MKTTILAFATTLSLATAALADNFDNTAANVTVNWANSSFSVNGDVDNGYTSATVGTEVLSYSSGANVNNTLDMSLTHYQDSDEFAIGAEYALAYSPSAWTVYGVAGAEYNLSTDVVEVTPALGVSYDATEAVTAWSEVSYTLDATDSWAQVGGTAGVGLDFAVATNTVLSTGVEYNFDQADGSADEAQFMVGMTLNF
jgi:hypothetical protein